MARQNATAASIESPEKDPPGGALARGLAVLDVVLEAAQPLTLAEISKRARLDLSTTMRLLRTLEESRYVLRVDDAKRYVPSPRAMLPLPVLHPLKQFRREVFPVLLDLSVALKGTVVLVAYLETERMVVEIAQSAGSLAPYYRTWLDGPVHASGSGKALLMTLPREARETLLGLGPYQRVTEFSITDPAKLHEDLEAANARGYAVARDEHVLGLTAIAANIPTWQGINVGCLVMTGHTRDCNEANIDSIGAQLRRAAGLIRHQAPSISGLSNYLWKSEHSEDKRGQNANRKHRDD
jgi:IclR family acetate operon transcriptional repressor